MAVRSGFFNAINHDRQYTTDDIAEIFNGIYTEGIFNNVNEPFLVKPASGMQVSVGVGSAWINNAYAENENEIILDLKESDPNVDRIDTVILEINKNLYKLCAEIMVLEGNTTLINNKTVTQVPLAYIHIAAGAVKISSNDIEYVVGTEVPYVEYIGVSASALIANDLTTDYPGKLLDAHQGKVLNDKSPFGFGIDGDGRYGYIKNGELIPFFSMDRIAYLGNTNGQNSITFDCSSYPGCENFTEGNVFFKNIKFTDPGTSVSISGYRSNVADEEVPIKIYEMGYVNLNGVNYEYLYRGKIDPSISFNNGVLTISNLSSNDPNIQSGWAIDIWPEGYEGSVWANYKVYEHIISADVYLIY